MLPHKTQSSRISSRISDAPEALISRISRIFFILLEKKSLGRKKTYKTLCIHKGKGKSEFMRDMRDYTGNQ